MSDTPRIDAFCDSISKKYKDDWNRWQLTASFAAELERELSAELATERELADKMAKSAQELIERWESPSWKDVPHTGKLIRSLHDALVAWKFVRDKNDQNHLQESNE